LDLLRSDHTHALGKWDIGFLEKKCSATYRGFDTFFGYYTACEADYWYHGASGGYPNTKPSCTRPLVHKTPFLSHSCIKNDHLPTQARDKHR
jgi:hypothetical protein